MRGRPAHFAPYVAFFFVGVVLALVLRYGSYVAVLTDPAAYVASAYRWLDSDLFHPVHFQLLPGWPNSADSGNALGFRASHISGTDVGEYPLGLPVFLAASIAILGEFGPYIAGALFVALLAGCAYGLGMRLQGHWCGSLAAVLIAASPVTIRHAMYPMSDVPAAAFWALAWLMSLRSGMGAAAAAGAAVAAATMIRPNLAPLAAVVAMLVLVDAKVEWPSRKWFARIALFAVLAALGPLLVLWSQYAQYGDPFTAGYKGAATFFESTRIPGNLTRYPRWLVEVHTAIIFAGLAYIPFALWRADSGDAPLRRRIVLSGLAIALLNFALYLPYLNFEQWTYLRFMLPAMTVLFLLFAATCAAVGRWLARRSRVLIPLAVVPALIIAANGRTLIRDAFQDGPNEMRVLLMVKYLREAAPANAVLLTSVHGGSMAHYTGRQIVRLDAVPPTMLDAVIARLQLRGQKPFFVLDEVLESKLFTAYFATSQFHTLDWAPRAESTSATAIWYMDPRDRAFYRSGGRWPMDVLWAPPPLRFPLLP